MAASALEEVKAQEARREAKERQIGFMWALLIGGVLLVCFASSLGQWFVPKHQYAPGNFQWSPDDAREIAFVIRILGVMAFAAGLVERLVVSIRYDRPVS